MIIFYKAVEKNEMRRYYSNAGDKAMCSHCLFKIV